MCCDCAQKNLAELLELRRTDLERIWQHAGRIAMTGNTAAATANNTALLANGLRHATNGTGIHIPGTYSNVGGNPI